VAAAGEGGKEPGEWDWTGVDITIEDVANIIEGLACWLTRIATAVMVIFLVLAGLRFMHARGNPTAYQSAVKNFQHVLIGILVIMAVYVIIATVAYAVGRTDFSLVPLVC
jgi:succinate dehydrogenase hydrophobic anchor subunit